MNNISTSTHIDLCGIITIKDGIVHLDTSFNSNAMCCADDETGEIVQREDYDENGWNEPKTNPRLASDFWGVWGDWNGEMCGGITLDDEYTYEQADEDFSRLPKVRPDEIATLPDGTYSVYAPEPL